MSQAELSRFITRALDDENLRTTLASNPDRAFQGFDLSDTEKAAVRSGDEQKLRDLGIDPMVARSWLAFHDARGLDQQEPELPGELRPET
jgi:hypothetical protein